MDSRFQAILGGGVAISGSMLARGSARAMGVGGTGLGMRDGVRMLVAGMALHMAVQFMSSGAGALSVSGSSQWPFDTLTWSSGFSCAIAGVAAISNDISIRAKSVSNLHTTAVMWT